MIVRSARYQRRRGITLIEMFSAMMLLAAFVIVATHLFGSVMGVYQTTDRAQTRASRYESAIEQMRRDVWSAGKIVVANPQTAEVSGPQGKITWEIDETGTMVRTVDKGSTRWEEAGKNLSFTGDSHGLLLNERGGDPQLATRLFNQAEQSAGGTQ